MLLLVLMLLCFQVLLCLSSPVFTSVFTRLGLSSVWPSKHTLLPQMKSSRKRQKDPMMARLQSSKFQVYDMLQLHSAVRIFSELVCNYMQSRTPSATTFVSEAEFVHGWASTVELLFIARGYWVPIVWIWRSGTGPGWC